MSEKLERRIEIYPSFDKRSDDPKKNYGIGCAEIAFYVVGERGAYQFKAFTGWYLPHLRGAVSMKYPSGMDVGYHAREPQYEEQRPMTGECQIIGGKCFYDGSGLAADDVTTMLVEKGHEAVFEHLEKLYRERFGLSALSNPGAEG